MEDKDNITLLDYVNARLARRQQCPAAEVLAVYLEGSASAAEAARLETHAAECPACGPLLAEGAVALPAHENSSLPPGPEPLMPDEQMQQVLASLQAAGLTVGLTRVLYALWRGRAETRFARPLHRGPTTHLGHTRSRRSVLFWVPQRIASSYTVELRDGDSMVWRTTAHQPYARPESAVEAGRRYTLQVNQERGAVSFLLDDEEHTLVSHDRALEALAGPSRLLGRALLAAEAGLAAESIHHVQRYLEGEPRSIAGTLLMAQQFEAMDRIEEAAAAMQRANQWMAQTDVTSL
jgi:hypothetical protein